MVMSNDRDIRLLLSEEFTEEGYDVTATGDTHLFTHINRQYHPDIIILDIGLSGGDRLDLLRNIRNKHESLPVILYSAYTSFNKELKNVETDYLVKKSFDLKELKTTVKKILEGGHPVFKWKDALDPVYSRLSTPFKQMEFSFS